MTSLCTMNYGLNGARSYIPGFETFEDYQYRNNVPPSEDSDSSNSISSAEKFSPFKGSQTAKLFIGGLSHDTTDTSLYTYFKQFGAVEKAEVLRDGHSLRSRGFGFITFKYPEAANIVLRFKTHMVDEKKVDVKVAVAKVHSAAGTSTGSNPPEILSFNGTSGVPYNHISSLASLSSCETNTNQSQNSDVNHREGQKLEGLKHSSNMTNNLKMFRANSLQIDCSPGFENLGLLRSHSLFGSEETNGQLGSPPQQMLHTNNSDVAASFLSNCSDIKIGDSRDCTFDPSMWREELIPNGIITSPVEMTKCSIQHRKSSDPSAIGENVLVPNKVFVGGLLYATGHESLRKYFEHYGQVDSAEVIYNRETKKSRGFGFVIFKEYSSVEEVLQRQEVERILVDGKQVEIKPCKAREDTYAELLEEGRRVSRVLSSPVPYEHSRYPDSQLLSGPQKKVHSQYNAPAHIMHSRSVDRSLLDKYYPRNFSRYSCVQGSEQSRNFVPENQLSSFASKRSYSLGAKVNHVRLVEDGFHDNGTEYLYPTRKLNPLSGAEYSSSGTHCGYSPSQLDTDSTSSLFSSMKTYPSLRGSPVTSSLFDDSVYKYGAIGTPPRIQSLNHKVRSFSESRYNNWDSFQFAHSLDNKRPELRFNGARASESFGLPLILENEGNFEAPLSERLSFF